MSQEGWLVAFGAVLFGGGAALALYGLVLVLQTVMLLGIARARDSAFRGGTRVVRKGLVLFGLGSAGMWAVVVSYLHNF